MLCDICTTKAICTLRTLNLSSKTNIPSWSSRFSPLYHFLHPLYLYSISRGTHMSSFFFLFSPHPTRYLPYSLPILSVSLTRWLLARPRRSPLALRRWRRGYLAAAPRRSSSAPFPFPSPRPRRGGRVWRRPHAAKRAPASDGDGRDGRRTSARRASVAMAPPPRALHRRSLLHRRRTRAAAMDLRRRLLELGPWSSGGDSTSSSAPPLFPLQVRGEASGGQQPHVRIAHARYHAKFGGRSLQ